MSNHGPGLVSSDWLILAPELRPTGKCLIYKLVSIVDQIHLRRKVGARELYQSDYS